MNQEIKENIIMLMGFTKDREVKDMYHHQYIKDVPFFFDLSMSIDIIVKKIYETGVNFK